MGSISSQDDYQGRERSALSDAVKADIGLHDRCSFLYFAQVGGQTSHLRICLPCGKALLSIEVAMQLGINGSFSLKTAYDSQHYKAFVILIQL